MLKNTSRLGRGRCSKSNMPMPFNSADIKRILPQRHPFLFIDRILEYDKAAGRVKCLKFMSVNEFFFKGHFPGNPVVPGVIIVEAMAQTGIILYALERPRLALAHPDYFLGKVDARFKKTVTAGDNLILVVTKDKLIDTGGIVSAVAEVNSEIVAEAHLMFGVKYKNA